MSSNAQPVTTPSIKTTKVIAPENPESGSPTSEPGPSQKQNESQVEPSSQTERSKCMKMVDGTKWVIQDQWFLLAMGGVVLLSSQVQVPASRQHTKRTVITYLSVAVIFFINGCTLEAQLLLQHYTRWKLHIFVQLQCYLVCSAASFGIVSICATRPDFMDPWLLIGMLFVGSAPTTMASNVVMTRQAHGNAALTVVQSVLGQVLCPFLTPVIVQMYLSTGAWYSKPVGAGTHSDVYRRVFAQLGLTLFLPMAAGQVVQSLFAKQVKQVFFDWNLVKLASMALLALVWQTFDQAFQAGAFQAVPHSNIVFLVFITLALHLTWLALCFATAAVWLPKKDVIACCYCCPAKALAMVVPLTSVMYVHVSPVEQSKLQIPAIVFQAVQVGVGGLMTIAFRRWIRPEEEKEESREEEEVGRPS